MRGTTGRESQGRPAGEINNYTRAIMAPARGERVESGNYNREGPTERELKKERAVGERGNSKDSEIDRVSMCEGEERRGLESKGGLEENVIIYGR